MLPRNKGFESLVFVPKGLPLAGTLIAISERGLDAHKNIIAFLLNGPQPTFRARYRRRGVFACWCWSGDFRCEAGSVYASGALRLKWIAPANAA